MASNNTDLLVVANYALWAGDYSQARTLLEEFVDQNSEVAIFNVTAQILLERVADEEIEEKAFLRKVESLHDNEIAIPGKPAPPQLAKTLVSSNGAVRAMVYQEGIRDFALRGYVVEFLELPEASEKLLQLTTKAGWKKEADSGEKETSDCHLWTFYSDNVFLTIQFDSWGLLVVEMKVLEEIDLGLVETQFVDTIEKISEALPPPALSKKN